MHTVGQGLHERLGARGVRGGDSRFKCREWSSRGGALAGEIGCGGGWRWRRRGWRRQCTLGIVRSLVLRLSCEQRSLAAKSCSLGFWGVEQSGAWVMDRGGGQR